MKSEALKALLEMARKRMADEGPGAHMEEDAAEIAVDADPSPEEASESEGAAPDMSELLAFLKSKAAPDPTSKMAAAPAKKAKGSHLFKKK